MLSFFPRDVLDEILNLIESVSEGFPSYSLYFAYLLGLTYSNSNMLIYLKSGQVEVINRHFCITGCVEKPGGWNGEVDVILEGSSVSVEVQVEEEDKDIEMSVSSVEVKTQNDDEMQTTAQAIVFSFLQRKHNRAFMKNFLVPSITVGTTAYRLAFYDSENDVLVSTLPETKLFDNYSEDLLCSVIVLFWMALNYRLLCSGVPQRSKLFEINDVKAGFFERVGDHLYVYQEKVTRPAPRASCAEKTPVPYGRGKPMDQELLDDCHIDFIGLKYNNNDN